MFLAVYEGWVRPFVISFVANVIVFVFIAWLIKNKFKESVSRHIRACINNLEKIKEPIRQADPKIYDQLFNLQGQMESVDTSIKAL